MVSLVGDMSQRMEQKGNAWLETAAGQWKEAFCLKLKKKSQMIGSLNPNTQVREEGR